ncbi:MAG: transposase [Candidatus Hydrogenedentes bacterium]|nr:transposase [Candidatus Hydrogenedentota bacterium]
MRLPHWETTRGIYFVTLRQAGSLPEKVLLEIRAIMRECAHQRDWGKWLATQRRIFLAMENALDHPDTQGRICQPDVAVILREAIQERQRRGMWDVMEYVLMSNHVHILFKLSSGTLDSSVKDFKRYTSRRILSVRTVTEAQPVRQSFWQREWFDHWSRDQSEDERTAEYIRLNPVKAGLVKDYRDWPWGSWNDPDLQQRRT